MHDATLDVFNASAGVSLVPEPIKLFGRDPELDDEIVGEVLWFNLAPLFPPEPEQGGFIAAHDYTCIRSTDEGPSIFQVPAHCCSLQKNRTRRILSDHLVADPNQQSMLIYRSDASVNIKC
jgi:hypothetical protein